MSDFSSHADAVKILGGRETRKIANNTYLERRTDGAVAVRLHRTDVVTFAPDGGITLDSGRWRTVTTRARMNAYLPTRHRVYQAKGQMYLASMASAGDWENAEHREFYDGMAVAS